MSYKKYILSVLLAFFASSKLLYSAAPLGGYTPGATNNPDCAPGDTDCFVQALVDTDAQTLSLSGSILSISNGNSVFLPIQPILELNSLTGAVQSFAVGDIGNDFAISSTGSTHTFNIPNASATSRGFVNTLTQSFEGIKTFLSDVIFDGNVTINGTLSILDGNQASGKILTSDASGNVSWQNPSITDNQTLLLTGNTLSISNGNSLTLNYLTSYTETDPLFTASPSFGIGTGSISNWNTAFGWGDHSTQGYLTSYTETDPIFTASPSFGIGTGSIANWNTAFGWGNHSTQGYLTGSALSGYLTSYTETDPIFTASPSFGIGTGSIANWNTAFGWGNHATQGYLTGSALAGYLTSETDPIFTASPSFGIGSGSISNWNTAFGWGNHATQGYLTGSALAGYLTSYTETDPVFSASPSFGIGSGSIANWNTAFGWGNHSTQGYLTGSALAGYLTSETDPIFTASPSFGIGTGNIANWNTAFGWGNHATQGYLTSYTETDPIFTASPSFGIGSGSIANWNTAFGWGNHATQGYLTSYTETDPIFTASPSFGIGTGSIANWNTAFGWGNHATQGYLTGSALAGYLTSETDPIFTASPSFGIGTGSIANWNTAFGWGNHATQGYLTGTTTNVPEGTNLYYTNARGIGSALTGFVSGSGTVTATDSVLQAIQKLQGSNTIQDTNISAKIGLTSLSASGPLSYNSGSGVFSISQATSGVNGYLSSADWNTFNGKQNALTFGNISSATPALSVINGTGASVGPNVSFSIANATSGVTGLLTSTDWNTFNSKLGSISVSAPSNGLSVTGSTLSLGLAGTSSTGALSSADWNTFNGKQNALTFGNISSSTPALSVSNGTGASVGPNVSFSIANSGSGTTGLLTSTDWNTFNAKIGLTSLSGISPIAYNNTNGQISWSGTTTNVAEGTNLYYTNARGIGSALTGFVSGSGTVTATDSVLQAIQKLQGSNTIQDTNISAKIGLTSLSASGPLSYNSGSGVFSISQATSGVNGYLSSADWNTFNGKLGSISVSAPSNGLSVTGSTLTLGLAGTSSTGALSSTDWNTFNSKISTALTSLNSLTGATQTFATGSTGTNFNIASVGSTHTFNIPDASATARGVVTIGTQTFTGSKIFSVNPTLSSMTLGSVPFIGTGGLLSQNNTNFFWDNANQRLGVGTSSPVATFHVQNATTSGIPTTATGLLATNALTRYRSSNSVLSFLTDTNSPYGIGFQAHDANTGAGLHLLLQPVFGNVGIGIVNPSAKLEIKHGTAGNSGLRFTNLTSSSTGGTYNGKVLAVNASGDVVLENLSLGTTPSLSSLTGATNTNTIDSLNFAQIWNWTTATTQTLLSFISNSITTGTVLDITSSNASLNSTNGLLRVANTGTSTGGIVFRAQSNSTAASGLSVLANGQVTINTLTPPSGAQLTIAADINPAADWDSNAQFVLAGKSNANKKLTLGYDTTNNLGYIQASIDGTSTSPLILNPFGGGNVGIGTLLPNANLEIKHGTAGNSGLRFTNLLSTDTGATNNMKQLSVNGSGDVILTSDIRQRVVLGSDVINNNVVANTIADVTGLSWAVTSGTRYQFECIINYTSASVNTGSRWTLNGPTTSLLSYRSKYTLSATTETTNYASAYTIPLASNANSLAAGNIAEIKGFITPSANGTVTMRFASEVASSAITAKAGSTCEYWSY